jgi:predicted esterase
MRLQMNKYSNFAESMSGLATLHFINGPRECDEDVVAKVPLKMREKLPPPYYEWWNARDDESNGEGTVVYDDLDRTLSLLREHEHAHGPFDGLLGFSQGGCVAHLACMLRLFASPPRFGIFISARLTRHTEHVKMVQALADEPLVLPSLVISGGKDTSVPPELTKQLSKTLSPGLQTRLCLPDGGHRIPKLEEEQARVLRGFLEAQMQV